MWIVPEGRERIAAAVCAVVLGSFLFFKPGIFLISGAVVCFGALTAVSLICRIYRCPRRSGPGNPDSIVACADGLVLSVERLDCPEFYPNGKALRICVRPGFWDAHVTRAPVSGRITRLTYREGQRKLSSDAAFSGNHSITLIEDAEGTNWLLVQLSGDSSRIVSTWTAEGAVVSRGTEIGFVPPRGRIELWFPADAAEIKILPGDRLSAGETVVAERIVHA